MFSQTVSLVSADLPRYHLNVEAASKGLIRGPLIIMMRDGTQIDCSTHDCCITHAEDYDQISIASCDAVLVVEKEAVYQTLAAKHAQLRCVVITGKGCNTVF